MVGGEVVRVVAVAPAGVGVDDGLAQTGNSVDELVLKGLGDSWA
jgi:hypothetical protein